MELQIIQSKIYEIRGQKVTEEEFEILMSQFVISSWGGVRKLPFAFTEQAGLPHTLQRLRRESLIGEAMRWLS